MINNWRIYRNTGWYDEGRINAAEYRSYIIRSHSIVSIDRTDYSWLYLKSQLPAMHFIFTGLKY